MGESPDVRLKRDFDGQHLRVIRSLGNELLHRCGKGLIGMVY